MDQALTVEDEKPSTGFQPLRGSTSEHQVSKMSYGTEIETQVITTTTKKNSRICAGSRVSIAFELLLLILAIIAIIQIFFVPDVLDNQFNENIEETVVMTASRQEEDDNKYRHWKENTFDDSGIQYFNFYIYNITNPHEVLEGAIPELNEIGPFIYRRFEFKNDVEFLNDSCLVKYRYDFDFIFEEELTKSQNPYDLNTTVTILNPGMLTFLHSFLVWNETVDIWAYYFQSLSGMKIFFQVPAQRVIEGVYDPGLVQLTGTPAAAMTFSLLNRASMDVVEHTGYCNKQDLRVLNMIWNTTEVTFWDPVETVYPAREPRNWPWKTITKEDNLTVWYLPFYRKVDYVFDKTVTTNGLTLWRFKPSNNTLKSAYNYAPNSRYFAFGPDGVLNFTARKIVPQQTVAYLSFPHFYQGPYYVEEINHPTGIRDPDPEVDSMYLDIEPQTGIVLRNWLGFQTNFELFPLPDIIGYDNTTDNSSDIEIMKTNFTKLPHFLVPTGYQVINAFAPSDVTKSLATSLQLINQVQDASLYGGVAVAVVFIALAVWLMCRRWQISAVEYNYKQSVAEEEED